MTPAVVVLIVAYRPASGGVGCGHHDHPVVGPWRLLGADMSADLLREAAALMRQRAEAATPSPWEAEDYSGNDGAAQVFSWSASWPTVDRPLVPADAEHIASWHPTVALAVADLLDKAADLHEYAIRLGKQGLDPNGPEFAVARAFLGRDS